MTVHAVTDATFEQEVLRAELPVLVDLYADWCQPCKAMAPILDQLSLELAGKVKFVKIDIEKSPMVAQTFKVTNIPMLVVFAQGQVANHHVGAADKNALLALLEPVLPRDASELKPLELQQLITQGRAVPVDLRDANSYKRFHIPTAIHLASEELVTRAQELQPVDGRIRVLYGRSGDIGKESAASLAEKGIQVGFLAGGFLNWEGEGLEVERGNRS